MYKIIGNEYHVDESDWGVLYDRLKEGFSIIHYYNDLEQCYQFIDEMKRTLSSEQLKTFFSNIEDSCDEAVPFQSDYPTHYKATACLVPSNNSEALIFLKSEFHFVEE